jgi:hypothetical protein
MSGHIADSAAVDWTTPQWVIDLVKEAFGGSIDLDPCSNEQSIVGARVEYRLPEDEGLVDTWQPALPEGGTAQTAFVNPPYGTCYRHQYTKEILVPKQFKALREEIEAKYAPEVAKSILADWSRSSVADWWRRSGIESKKMRGIATLAPAAVSSVYWHTLVWPVADAVFFPRGRLKFGGGPEPTSAPMDVALGVYAPDKDILRRLAHIVRREDLGVIHWRGGAAPADSSGSVDFHKWVSDLRNEDGIPIAMQRILKAQSTSG